MTSHQHDAEEVSPIATSPPAPPGGRARGIRAFDAWAYPDLGDRWDLRLARERLLRLIRPGATVLDLGAGRGEAKELDFRDRAVRVAGVDPDPAVLENPLLSEARLLGEDGRIPYEDGTFDVAYAINVLEHVSRPVAFLEEVRRVLAPGGQFFLKTTNRRHYVALAAASTPFAFHRWYNELRGRAVEDTFPTYYRCNTRAAITSATRAAGLRLDELDLVEGRPEYLRIWLPLYVLGWLYERTVNRIGALEGLRAVVYGVLSRGDAP